MLQHEALLANIGVDAAENRHCSRRVAYLTCFKPTAMLRSISRTMSGQLGFARCCAGISASSCRHGPLTATLVLDSLLNCLWKCAKSLTSSWVVVATLELLLPMDEFWFRTASGSGRGLRTLTYHICKSTSVPSTMLHQERTTKRFPSDVCSQLKRCRHCGMRTS